MNDKFLIYAVDDEESICELYECVLDNAGFKVKTFQNGKDMLDALNFEIPHLFILDIMMDGLTGFDLTKLLRNNPKTQELPIILISAKGEELSKVKGLNLGADDYLEKPFGVLELVARINSKLKNVKLSRLEYKSIIIDDTTHEVYINNVLKKYTVKEYNLLKYLVISSGKVVSREELLDKIWGINFCAETRTLDMHISTLRKSLEGSGIIIETVRGIGFKLI